MTGREGVTLIERRNELGLQLPRFDPVSLPIRLRGILLLSGAVVEAGEGEGVYRGEERVDNRGDGCWKAPLPVPYAC